MSSVGPVDGAGAGAQGIRCGPRCEARGSAIRVGKELREMVGLWVPGLLVAATAFALPTLTESRDGQQIHALNAVVYITMCVIGVVPFGREFNYGTMPRLLAMPVSRTRIWSEKMAALAVVLLTIAVVEWVGFRFSLPEVTVIGRRARNELDAHMFIAAGFALCNGTLFSLLTRQPFTAFWLAFLAPLAAAVLVIGADELVWDPLLRVQLRTMLFHDDTRGFFVLWAAVTLPLGLGRFKRVEV